MTCRKACDCRPNKCNPITGECLTENAQIIFDSSVGNTSTSPNIMKLARERIKAKHWIQVHGNGKWNIKNCTTPDQCTNETLENATVSEPISNSTNDKIVNLIGKTHQHHVQIHKNNTLMINALNSSIANLTSDVDKLSKQIFDQQSEIKRVTNDVLLPKIGIFLDAPAPTAVIAQISEHDNTDNNNNRIQPVVLAVAPSTNNVGNVLENVIALPNENAGRNTMNPETTAVLMSVSSLNQHVGKDSHRRRNNRTHEKQQQQQQQKISVIETSQPIQQQMGQDSNSNDNENYDDGVTELNNNENEIFHVFDNVENDNNTVGDTVSMCINTHF